MPCNMEPRYLLAALVLALLWTAESIVPAFTNRSRRLSHNASNFALAAINGALSFSLAFLILAVTNFAQSHHFGLLPLLALPTWLSWIVALLLFDCWQYWWHRLNHRVPFLWRFHALHHADAELDVSSGVRFHTVEIAFSILARLAVLPLLGLTVPHLLLYETIALPIILFHHSNISLPPALDRALRLFIVTPHMHFVHHSRFQPETDSNYASGLSIWDRLFRSFRLRERPEEIKLGLDHWQPSQWRSLKGMLLTPFQKRPPHQPDSDSDSEN